ncbi:Pentatricopeptide repeat-containing protein [Zea mays]|uniref:Pentatricopeptide repeat-containing protein n=1 Tax=Zea mays TaxID=4577 RepID=A0A3L6F7N8_MAIZE|nr:Pentatricopeptide repeat-containing protein [Zea mays]
MRMKAPPVALFDSQMGVTHVLFEQPVHRDDWEGLRDVNAVTMEKYKVIVVANESCRSLLDAQKIIQGNLSHVINIKLAKLGCRCVGKARAVFDGMGIRNNVSWCSMVVAYAQNGAEEEAFLVYLGARRAGEEPTDFMVSSVLTTCAGLLGLDLGRALHAVAVCSCIDSNIFVASALVDMYGKCGGIEDAEQVFFEMPQRNLVTWNAMIGGYAHIGDAHNALSVFDKMIMGQETALNYITLVNVLTACNRGGLTKEGYELFQTMKWRFGIEPRIEHYACVVDLLCRAGMEERAYEIIQGMPMRPSISVSGALLGGCKMHGKTELGRIAAEKLFELDPQDSGNHVLLSNMLASAGRWAEATDVRKEMKNVGIKKDPGRSWITWKNVVHVFQAKDTTHDMNREIQALLAKLKGQMQAAGYMPDTQYALYSCCGNLMVCQCFML